jgi:hypothetical protein
MNIDWTSLSAGFDEGLQKSAARRFNPAARPTVLPVRKKPVPTPAPTAAPGKPNIPLRALGVGTGVVGTGGLVKLYNKGDKAFSDIGDMMESGKSLLPLGLSALMSGKNRNAIPQGNPMDLLQSVLGGKKNILNYDTMDPRSLTSPSLGYGVPKVAEKKADISDLMAKAVQQRAINSIIDNTLLSGPKAAPEQSKSEKELELVAKHPEMNELLKDEQNKAYLEKLLKESR